MCFGHPEHTHTEKPASKPEERKLPAPMKRSTKKTKKTK
jgi:hypothetical protein